MDCSSVAWSFNFLEAGAGGVVFIDAGETEFEELALDVVLCGGVGCRNIDRGKRTVDLVIEGNGGLRSAGFGEHGGGVIAEGGIGMDLLHKLGEVGRRS
jgi:hypothetical protein